MSVNKELDQVKESFVASMPDEAQVEFQFIKEQIESGIEFGLKEGGKAPNFTLANPLGEQVNLYDELAKGPVVLTFYRGSWCPFCNVMLNAYQKLLPEIDKLGGQLIAVTPQSPDNSLSHKEKEDLTFEVLSDPNGSVTESFKLLYEVPEYMQSISKDSFNLDLTEFNKTDRWILPVPGTFIIDKEGIIRRAHVDPDFMKRMESQEILDELKKL
ncbi:peroxiredoxin-like family protein [Cohnella luojiensis]|uniref:thioredoxin-dependent peroxiredoxin n=1 Tax=Cohnella luojiensis TaxID=652876 RepID=A0A4Y8M0D7_9BACL|nr:peroxiredoxin-like family protein [Cohnella luojiensis]TFE27550.1 AhpC/TSA family protein [Cohnella luojiensis]